MITIAFVDTLGLCYDGGTLNRRGLGGSESAVISMSRELANLGYKVYVFNDCASDDCKPGVYNGVIYEPINNLDNYNGFDIFIGSRSVVSFVPEHMKHEFKWATNLPNIERVSMASGLRILWMHDTFCDGDNYIEDLVTSGRINKVFTLSDWHTTYITNCHHGKRRHYETLKRHIFQTRNGINLYHNAVDISAKDPDLFVYNSSVTKGMIPLVENIWPKVQERYPNAKLTIVGGFYRFRSDHGPDEQELTHRELVEKHAARGVNFTGIISQKEIADLLSKASYMIYPSAFPETFGISTLESLAYNTPLITCNQGALEETAIDLACYKMNYAIEPNVLFTEIDLESQCEIFVDLVSYAYENKYLHQQKMYACNQVKSVCEWSTVALEWKRFFCDHVDNHYMPIDEYRKYLDINDTVNRVFNRYTQTRRSLRVRKQVEQPIKIVLPVYNSENYIKRCLDSILCQDYDNYEIIVIDDYSTDSTIEIVKRYNDGKIKLISRQERMGAVYNQVNAIKEYCDPNDITILIDGDDWLFNDPHVFDYVNHLYHEGAEFTYGSCWSLADNIPLIAQPYPEHIKKKRDYRSHKFNWGMPYTHLRTFKSSLIMNADDSNFKNSENKWYQAGGDNSVFFTAIENANPENVICVPEVLYVYNDLNPLNDYKVNRKEQTKNANEIINNKQNDFFENKQNTFRETKMNSSSTKKILLAVPTNKYIEVETFKSIYDLEVPDGYEIDFQYFYGYQIDQIRNLIADWAKHYDYLFSVDSDIVLPKDSLKKLLEADKDIVSGLYIQRIPNTHTLEVYKPTANGGTTNIDVNEIDFSQSLHEIAGCGFGCVLIKSEVFREIQYPHFMYKSALNHQDTVSEDTYFCIKAREHGFKIYMDVTIQCEHVGSTKFLVEPPKKYSVIIPTMWRSLELTKKALVSYIENPLVGEVILIDNDKSRTPDWSELKHEKIRLLTQEQNIFVNPAWNLGVQESKHDLICIANDDIVVDSKVFDRLKNEITVDKGMFGLNAGITEIGQPPITDGSIDLQEWRVGDYIHCFGQFMFIHKNNWLPIIDGLDISMGEDFQFHNQIINGRKNYMICNCFFESVENERDGVVYYGGVTSTDESIVSNTWDKEIKVYEKWFLDNPAPEEYRINYLYSH